MACSRGRFLWVDACSKDALAHVTKPCCSPTVPQQTLSRLLHLVSFSLPFRDLHLCGKAEAQILHLLTDCEASEPHFREEIRHQPDLDPLSTSIAIMGAWGYGLFQSDHDLDALSFLDDELGLTKLQEDAVARGGFEPDENGWPPFNYTLYCCSDKNIAREHLETPDPITGISPLDAALTKYKVSGSRRPKA